MRRLLFPVTWLYRLVVAVRNAAYDAGLFKSVDVGVPVISVGNLSTGGTGKTPVVEEIARVLLEEGRAVGVLSRGYGRRTSGFRWVQNGTATDSDALMCGDEPVQMARSFPRLLVAVDEDRVRGARRMMAESGLEVLILDDAFQHRRVVRSFDVVVMRREELLRGGTLLPAGDLREPLHSLRRAHAVVVTGCSPDDECRQERERLRPFLPDDVVCSAPEILAVRRLGEAENVPLGGIRNKKVLLVSGIGNPGGFLRTMAAHGCSVAGHLAFRDHRVFTLRDIASIRQAFGSHGCEVVVTTQKDAVRLERADLIEALGDLPVFHTVMRLRWVGGQAPFLERLKRLG